jgi:hypothetical protein
VYLCPTPVILASREAEIRRISVRSQPSQTVLERLTQNTHQKMVIGVGQELEHLPLKQEALSSNSSTTKKKRKNHHRNKNTCPK